MSDIKLTKDSDTLICVLYKSYLEARKSGASKREAKMLGGASDIQRKLMQKWSLEDVEDTLWSLHRLGLISAMPADNTVYFATLTDDGIYYMENRFKDGISGLIEHLSKLISLIP